MYCSRKEKSPRLLPFIFKKKTCRLKNLSSVSGGAVQVRFGSGTLEIPPHRRVPSLVGTAGARSSVADDDAKGSHKQHRKLSEAPHGASRRVDLDTIPV